MDPVVISVIDAHMAKPIDLRPDAEPGLEKVVVARMEALAFRLAVGSTPVGTTNSSNDRGE